MLQQLKDLLTDNYAKNNSSVISRLLSIVSTELEHLKQTLQTIDSWRDIDKAQGNTLDKIGRNFNEPRLNRTDDEYRRFIATKIAANRSGGDIETINNVCATIFGNGFVNAQETDEPAAIMITFNEEAELEIPSPYIKRVVAAGVHIDSTLVFERKNIGIFSSLSAHEFKSSMAGNFVANGAHGGSKFRRRRLV